EACFACRKLISERAARALGREFPSEARDLHTACLKLLVRLRQRAGQGVVLPHLIGVHGQHAYQNDRKCLRHGERRKMALLLEEDRIEKVDLLAQGTFLKAPWFRDARSRRNDGTGAT